jgi:superfamily I DNA/RNA helicase
VLSPESAGRHGKLPSLVTLPSLDAEVDHFVATARKLHARGMPWGDMAVLYRNRFIAERFYERLDKAGIPCDWKFGDGALRARTKEIRAPSPSVKLLTMHASKGLEFQLRPQAASAAADGVVPGAGCVTA